MKWAISIKCGSGSCRRQYSFTFEFQEESEFFCSVLKLQFIHVLSVNKTLHRVWDMNEHFSSLVSKFITFLAAHVTRIYFIFDSILFSVNVRMSGRNRVVIKSESRAIFWSFGFFMFGSLIPILFFFCSFNVRSNIGKIDEKKGHRFLFYGNEDERKHCWHGERLNIDYWWVKIEHKIAFLCEYFSNEFKVKC